MNDIEMEGKSHASVWRVAITAVAVFLAAVLVISFFGSAEMANLPAAKV